MGYDHEVDGPARQAVPGPRRRDAERAALVETAQDLERFAADHQDMAAVDRAGKIEQGSDRILPPGATGCGTMRS